MVRLRSQLSLIPVAAQGDEPCDVPADDAARYRRGVCSGSITAGETPDGMRMERDGRRPRLQWYRVRIDTASCKHSLTLPLPVAAAINRWSSFLNVSLFIQACCCAFTFRRVGHSKNSFISDSVGAPELCSQHAWMVP